MEKQLTITVEVKLAADFNFYANTDFLIIRKGQTGALALSAEPLEGFAGELTFAVDQPPVGFVVSFPNGNTVIMDGVNVRGVGVEIQVGEEAEVLSHALTFRVTGEHTGS